MVRFLILSCLLAFTCGQPQSKYCCSPPQFEINEGELSMYVEDKITHLVKGRIVISYDYTHNRIAFVESIVNNGVPENLHFIMDFNAHLLYIIPDPATCTIYDLVEGSVTYRCVPDSAEWRGSYYYGSGTHTLLVDSYRMVNGTETTFLQVSRDHCLPIEETIHGSNDQGQVYLQTNDYVNAILGIREAEVFALPSNCARPIKRSNDIRDETIAYIHRRFTRGGQRWF